MCVENNDGAEIISIFKLLEKEKLSIPYYQRPYKWTTKNIETLLNDIEYAISESKKYETYKYRIGTIIIHKDGEKEDVVDGQQRIISLYLILKCLEKNITSLRVLNNKITQNNICENYKYIENRIKKFDKGELENAFNEILEVVVLYVDKIEEAFQLFDSQNTRGKELDPHDLLKAYHLREMVGASQEMKKVVKKWEDKDVKQIRTLFKDYLYPIIMRSKSVKNVNFTVNNIDEFKGVKLSSNYNYAKFINHARPYFQITESFIAGKDFFEMVDYYIGLKDDIEEELKNNDEFSSICNFLISENKKDIKKDDEEINRLIGECNKKNCNYSKQLFWCVLLQYYDKFNNFDERAVKNLFKWAMMLRVEMDRLALNTVWKYAVGEQGYINSIPMFKRIKEARNHDEISNIDIELEIKNGNK